MTGLGGGGIMINALGMFQFSSKNEALEAFGQMEWVQVS